MVKVDLNTLELNEFRAKENPAQQCKATLNRKLEYLLKVI